MRISTGMIYDSGIKSIQSQTSSLLHTQQQISSGRRILSPSDDPVAAAQALVIDQSKAINTQYGVTQENAKSTLGLVDGQLSSANDLLVRIRELAVQAGNASLSTSDRASISTELRARFDELIGLANSTDGSGQYLFSGYQGSTKPFAGSVANGVIYQGDDGQRALQVSSSRNLPVSDSGNDVFMNIKNGNGIFVTGTQTQRSANAIKPTFDGWSSTVAAAALPATTGDVDLRFWRNPVATQGVATGSVDLQASPVAIGGAGNSFTISVNGASPPATVNVPPGIVDDTNAVAILQNAVDNTIGAGVATVSLNASNNVVVTSTMSGAASSITILDSTGIFGQPTSLAGSNAGAAFYDLVDPATGNSLFTGVPSDTSTPAGQAGYTGHAYTSGSPISLTGTVILPAVAFDFGANVTISGVPQDGDVFSLNRSNASLTVVSPPVAPSINAGAVNDPVKWSSVGNSGNLEVRFWVDAAGVNVPPGVAGQTYYDLVDANTGESLFTGNSSDITTPAGQAGYIGHPYTSGVAIGLSSVAPVPVLFDFGASVTISGNPVTGDTFTLRNSADPTGNGYFVTAPKMTKAENTGSGIVGTGEVLDAAKWNNLANSGKLEVRFWKNTAANPPATYYDLVDATTEKSLFTDTVSTSGGTTNTFTHKFSNGDAIPFTGLAPAYGDFGVSVTINGTPQSGDVFTLNKSTSESIFSTLGRFINALESPVGTGSNGNTALHNTLGTVLTNLGQATDNLLAVRASIGSRLNEIDSLGNVVADMDLQYSTTLSNLQDVDFAQAITDMTRNQTQLEAAQKSFVNVSKLSLFNYV
ncbi:MAG: flagellar hook-associated protein FlgL [Sterolibacterium sp.]